VAADPRPTASGLEPGSRGDQRRDERGRGVPPGKIVAVWGATGAPGRSVVALGLASAVAERGVPTMVVDVDVYGGAQAQLLGLLDESSGLLAAARAANRGRLDRQQLASHARAVSPTLRVLTGLPRSDRWVELGPVLLRRILETSRSLCELTVLDCGFCVELDEEISYDVAAPRRNGATLAALQTADLVVVVGSADPVGLGRLLRAVADLRVQAPDVAPLVVVNRMRSSLGWSGDEVATMVRRTTQLEVEAFLPDDPAACDRAVVHGQSLHECAPGSRLTRALDELARTLTGRLGLATVTAPSHRAG
jgi:MinD-like ATPase involved in chromosome partitioning or flagellar assembly